MVDIAKQIIFWRDAAVEDFDVARELLTGGRPRHGLFFVHLAAEKIIKAHVCKNTGDLAPRIHNLVRLAELAALSLQSEQLDVLAELNAFNIEGRYPDSALPQVTAREAEGYLAKAQEVFHWLINQL